MRSRILDSVEALSNLVALNSHLRELQTEDKTEELKVLYDAVLKERRELQTIVENLIDKSEGHYHCAFKHAIWYYMYANELEDADPAFKGFSERAVVLLNFVLSKMTGQEITLCSRCLADKILKDNKEQDGV